MTEVTGIALCYPCEFHQLNPFDSSEPGGPLWPSTTGLFWQKLKQRDPDERARTCGVDYDNGTYRVPCFGESWLVDPGNERIEKVDGPASFPFDRIVPFPILVYLATAEKADASSEMLPPRDLYAGKDLFRATLTLRTERLLDCFGSDPSELVSKACALGAERLDGADAALRFHPLPRVAFEWRLYAADAEFPAEIHVLIDSQAPSALPGDALSVLINAAIARLCRKG